MFKLKLVIINTILPIGICIISLGMKSDLLPVLHLPKKSEYSNQSYPVTYPNPFKEQTTILYNSLKDENLSIKLYTNNGIFIDLIYDDIVEKNVMYKFELDGSNLKPGVYYYTLECGTKIIQRRIELIR